MSPKTEPKIIFLPSQFKGIIPKDDCFHILPIELVREFKAFAFEKDGEDLAIAAVDPHLKSLHTYLSKSFKGNIEWFHALPEDVDFIVENYNRDYKKEITDLTIQSIEKGDTISLIVDKIISHAFKEKASDVHIEPSRDDTTIRFRIDGVLQKTHSIPKKFHSSIIARFKVLANLKIDESRRPQEGRIEPKGFLNTLLRISTVPTLFGEKIVLRILDDSNKSLLLSDLGFSPEQQKMLIRNIEKPFGMIIASGPTGSGKTTTLYGLLQLIRKDGINISTLEDPIEYILSGVNQIQINSRFDLTFAHGLRALLRQDPDIIMVGEIRDSETAVMATDAAMTGHLVFSTLHTNNAPSVFVRLLEMSVEDFVIASTVNFIIAQRLVRKVCNHCAVKEPLSEATYKKVLDRSDILNVLNKEYNINPELLQKEGFKRGVGCNHCFQSGYVGRIGIYECLELNKEIHDLILAQKSSEIIKEAAERNGFKDMVSDGVFKVLEGITTFDEVIRTTRNV